METYKSIFDSEIVNNKEKIIYLWDLIIVYWQEINSASYLRSYLENNPIRMKLGSDYIIFMNNYSLAKFNNSNSQLLNTFFPEFSGKKEYRTKENLNYKDLLFLEIIFNEVNFKLETVKNEQQGRKSELFISLPKLISELISILSYSFIPFTTNFLDKNFSFQKLISNKNAEIIKIIPNRNVNIKNFITEYLLVKTKNDLKVKIRILTDFYKFIDNKKSIIENEFGKEIKNKIFSEMNNLNIRHDILDMIIKLKLQIKMENIYMNFMINLVKSFAN